MFYNNRYLVSVVFFFPVVTSLDAAPEQRLLYGRKNGIRAVVQDPPSGPPLNFSALGTTPMSPGGRQSSLPPGLREGGRHSHRPASCVDHCVACRGDACYLCEPGYMVLGGLCAVKAGSSAEVWLKYHNVHRCQHLVPALVWSDDAAFSAKGHADELTDLEHSGSENDVPPAGPAGENLAKDFDSEGLATDAWYDEVQYCDWPGCTDENARYFTAMIWESAKELGCGRNGINKIEVCRYRTSDNPSGSTNCSNSLANTVGCFESQVKPPKHSVRHCLDLYEGTTTTTTTTATTTTTTGDGSCNPGPTECRCSVPPWRCYGFHDGKCECVDFSQADCEASGWQYCSPPVSCVDNCVACYSEIKCTVCSDGYMVIGGLCAVKPATMPERWLKFHNVHRCRHGSTELTWSAASAASAQEWADSLVDMASSDSLTEAPPAGPAAENLAKDFAFEGAATDEWYAEVEYCKWPGCYGTAESGKDVEHFTTMIWKGTKELGCGRNAASTVEVCRYRSVDNPEGCDMANTAGCHNEQVGSDTRTLQYCIDLVESRMTMTTTSGDGSNRLAAGFALALGAAAALVPLALVR